jgi:hypothetical protein
MEVNWTDFKTFVQARSLSIQWVSVGANYLLKASDGFFHLDCLIPNDDALSSETVDFETNFQAAGNVKPSEFVSVQALPSFGAKTFLSGTTFKKLFARNTGKPFAVTTGSNDLSYTATYPWAKITGLECIGAEIGDYAELRVYDNASGTYSGVANALLNQFGYTLYLAKDYYRRDSKFDSDIYVGMVLKITYNSISNKNVYINYLMDEAKT